MKYLLLIALALALLWWWRTMGRKASGRDPQNKAARATPVQAPDDMVACRHCGLHLPRPEAVTGQQGLYCSQAHQSAQEAS
jgi:uncharacterized protein